MNTDLNGGQKNSKNCWKFLIKMAQQDELSDQINQILMKLEVSEKRQKLCEEQITLLNESHFRSDEPDGLGEIGIKQTNPDDEDITPDISSGDDIQLESYKSIPEFSGIRGTYRPWRNQVVRRMRIIDAFRRHPKYEAALGIVRSKITGAASNAITNNKTAYNIIAILRTLDRTFTDQRPLYVVEADMTAIRQGNKSLHDFHNAINHALNIVISKIVMSYPTVAEQQPLITEAQKKAVRTFIIGVNSQMIRHILYGRTPGTLAEAYAIAQTVHHDRDHLQLEQNRGQPNNRSRNNSYQMPNQQPNRTDTPNNAAKKYYDPRRQNQEQMKNPKINKISEENVEFDGEPQAIEEDLMSITSNESETSSAFLDE